VTEVETAGGLAIVGIGVALDGCTDVATLDRAIFTLDRPDGPRLDVDALLALLRGVLGQALADAGLSASFDVPIVAQSVEIVRALERQGVRAECGDVGPVGSLTTAARLLADRRHPRGAVALIAAEIDPEAATGTAAGEATLSFDRRAWGVERARGAIALVVSRIPAVPGTRPYAVVEAIGESSTFVDAMHSALAEGRISPAEVGYLEAWASGVPIEDDAEVAALTEVYVGRQPTCALGSVKTTVGDLGAAAGLAGLVRASLSLRGRYLPGTPRWTGPRAPDDWRGTALYVPGDSRPWIVPSRTRRLAGVNAMDSNGRCTHVLLAEPPAAASPAARVVPLELIHLLPIVGTSTSDLLEAVRLAEGSLAHGESAVGIARRSIAMNPVNAPLAVAILGHSPAELRRELQAAARAIPLAVETGVDWLTPSGSCFAPRPLGQRAHVAFVYPGAFASYPGLAREAFRLFPWLWEPVTAAARDLDTALSPRLLFPRHLERPTVRDLGAADAALADDAVAMMSSGAVCALVYTLIARECFGIEPQLAFGYSFGELSMLAALGVWPDALRSTRPRTSELFRSRLAGPKMAVREYFESIGVALPEMDEDLWGSYLVLAPADRVREAIYGARTVFLTTINSPAEVVVAGRRVDCVQLLESHGWQHVRMPFAHTLHSPPVCSERDEFVRLAALPRGR
jgi:acyl transferase domain-containing protein